MFAARSWKVYLIGGMGMLLCRQRSLNAKTIMMLPAAAYKAKRKHTFAIVTPKSSSPPMIMGPKAEVRTFRDVYKLLIEPMLATP